MGRLERPLAPDAGPVTAFARELRRLRTAAGSPGYRDMATRAMFSASVLSDAAAGYRLPTLQVALAFAEACGGDRASWERRWHEAARADGDDGSARPAVKAVQQHQENELRAADVRAVLPPPSQLPMEAHPLVGRRELLQRARALTAPSPDGQRLAAPLVISGQVGVGKTAFALRLAHELAVNLPDGQLYANLDPAADGRKDAAGIAGGFLEALGIPTDRIPNDPGQRIGLYRSLLNRRRLLVVLDGVQHERQIRELLVAAPESRVIITSRSRLLGLDGIGRIRLPALDRDESMELLAQLLGGDRVGDEPRACLRLADACGDLPLALNLAGRRIAARPEWMLQDSVSELLGDGPGGPVGRQGRDGQRAPGRFLARLQIGDDALSTRLDSAYRLLTPWARLMLRQFAGSDNPPSVDNVVYESADALAMLVERSAQPVEDLLERLLDAGLLDHSDLPGQYGLTPMARAYALTQPDPTEEDPAPAPAPARGQAPARQPR
ncbi:MULTISPECIES: NB-ARC domain-containing protein [Streptomyces]|uniref:NB-ARC domain-containing protein n=1 Tax=Streptomyces virginiae TaxID=1961 RepID=A0ABZ1TCF2_STRVG|nr:NB-ARC domain-containing protein [Streptomyces virginiae]WTB23701.1 NB-ARC domain-containing protein [Streptomyces virginiae]